MIPSGTSLIARRAHGAKKPPHRPEPGPRYAAEKLFLESLEANPDAVVLVDETGAILHSNALIDTVFGYRREELLGHSLELLIPPRFRDRHRHHLSQFFIKSGTRRMGEALELKGLRKDGTEFPIDVALSPLHAKGKLLVAAAIRDMSVYRKLEEQLRQRSLELEEADRLKDQFLATLAHELRNPLAALSLAGQRLRSPRDTDRIPRVADVIEMETAHMARLVEELLDVARLRQGKVNLRMETVDLGSAAELAVEISRALIDSRGHTLHFAHPAAPIAVHGDRTRLCQVIANLLGNAARYTPEGGHVWLSIDTDAGEAIVRVKDNGIGIPPGAIPGIFELFTQFERTGIASNGGLGIGLALVKHLVAMHGGTVAASSDGPGQGSEFIVRLPLIAEPHALKPGVSSLNVPR